MGCPIATKLHKSKIILERLWLLILILDLCTNAVRLNEYDRGCLKAIAKNLQRTEADAIRLIVREFAKIFGEVAAKEQGVMDQEKATDSNNHGEEILSATEQKLSKEARGNNE